MSATEQEERTPKVGIGLFLIKRIDGNVHILLSQRKVEFGRGEWSLPGGHVQEYEDPVDACKREVLEETGIKVTGAVRPITFFNYINLPLKKHYITLYYFCDEFEGEPMNMEPDKHGPWSWFHIAWLPFPIWQGISMVVKQYWGKFEKGTAQ